jgi:CCR4-NOT transcriptional complex subunit CAF120
MIAMYPSNKTKDKKRLLYTATRVSQAFAVYPERPEVINQSSLFKIESTIKDEQVGYLLRILTLAIDFRRLAVLHDTIARQSC